MPLNTRCIEKKQLFRASIVNENDNKNENNWPFVRTRTRTKIILRHEMWIRL